MFWPKAPVLAAAFAVTFAAAPASAGVIEVVSARAEFAKAHPTAARATPTDFHAAMDRVFGPGRWRQTSGYRTPAQEAALRRQGAGAVAAGRTSLHSVGDPETPGAYDAVVDRVPPAVAAARLRRAGVGFSRVIAEGAHGPQGPHLHVELVSTRDPAGLAKARER